MQVTEHKVLLNCKCPIATTKGSGTGFYKIWLIIVKEIIAIAMIGPCEMSGPSPKFFGVSASFQMAHCLGPICLSRVIRGWGGGHSMSS